jgi:RNase adapter protein RapZ
VTSVADARIPAVPDAELEDLVVLTGVSGAGKSTAMAVFEDAGYFCVDNLPPEMIASLVELFVHEGSKVERAAVATDARGGDFFGALRAVLEELPGLGVHHRLVFLDCDDREILTRFQETRRRHPVAVGSSVELGISTERALVEPLRELADAVIDSTGLKPHMLRRKIADELLRGTRAARLAVSFESFGFKHGPAPRDADLVFDVRFLPNPHYELSLRPRTGLEPDVVAYIDRDGALADFYARLEPLLDFLLPRYVAEGKSHLTVGIGCTGGRHRSVAIAEHLASRYAERDDAFVEVAHRDLGRG